jgi:prolipoprotein diacylglyceryl transferase
MFHFNLPLLGRPILWYGFFFAAGFLLAYWIFLYMLKHVPEKEVKTQAKMLAEKLTFYAIVGTIVGARLVDVFFYQSPSSYLYDPLSIIKVWTGGLASHGGALGILIALWIFAKRYPLLSWSRWLDLVVIPAGLVGFFIRIGNFVNQEVLGTVTNVPWAVVFGHPADGSLPLPRHPVQLYEALFYLAVFGLLLFLFHKTRPRDGRFAGLFLTLVFLFRFFIEFFKEEQSRLITGHAVFDMGQLLSVPLLALGVYLLARK